MKPYTASIAMIGSHLPRRCGIATFTADTAQALRDLGLEVDVFAMSDGAVADYPRGVVMKIDEDSDADYVRAAAAINSGRYACAHLQHEYGIFGGTAGGRVLALVEALEVPLVTTLHTVLEEPDADQARVMGRLLALSDRVVVMSERARKMVVEVHGVDGRKVNVVPHGIPDLPEFSRDDLKAEFGLASVPVVLTFGLLSPGKGIETVIEALAAIPEAVYLIVGRTHPHIVRHSGEAYRESLVALAERVGVASRVRFVDEFVSPEELGRFVKMADVYVSPYVRLEQITSGTLAMTVGNGKATVSTPTWHAQELLADDRGILVPPKDPRAMAEAVNGLLGDDDRRARIERAAFAYGRTMRWPVVARTLAAIYAGVAAEGRETLQRLLPEPAPRSAESDLPPIRLDHLEAMTDDTGLLQHAVHRTPNRAEGYCLDDNARALLLVAMLEAEGRASPTTRRLHARYLAFCAHALNPATGRFRNFMGYDRAWLESVGSEDSHGRALWCLGAVSSMGGDPDSRAVARKVFGEGLAALRSLTSPRAWAYACLGCVRAGALAEAEWSVRRLLETHRRTATTGWPWFEESLTYANARLAEALIVGGAAIRDRKAVDVGLEALEWLGKVQDDRGAFSPVGSRGFWVRDGSPAVFAQQPIEAASHVGACASAYRATGDGRWIEEAERAFRWFLGENRLGLRVADVESGACRDGLEPWGLNENCGAESTVSYLIALAEVGSLRAARAGCEVT